MLLQQARIPGAENDLQQRRGGVDAAGVIEGSAGLLQGMHDHRRRAGEIIRQFSRTQERHLRAVCPRQLGDFVVVGTDHHLVEQAGLPSAVRIERAIIGTPSNGLRFLRGMRLLPPRAGMIATLLKGVFPAETR